MDASSMPSAALSSLDFKAIARQVPSARLAQSSDALQGDELIPTEIRSRMTREGQRFMRRPAINGMTVDQEGLTNNYAVEPELYYALFPSPEQAREYALQAGLSVLFVSSIIFTAFAVS